VKWIGLWKGTSGELLAVLVNWGTTEQKAAFTVNGKSPEATDEQDGRVKTDALAFGPFEMKMLRIGK